MTLHHKLFIVRLAFLVNFFFIISFSGYVLFTDIKLLFGVGMLGVSFIIDYLKQKIWGGTLVLLLLEILSDKKHLFFANKSFLSLKRSFCLFFLTLFFQV